MYILDAACENITILRIIYFVKLLLNIVFIAVPAVLIVMVVIDFVKAVMGTDEKDQNKNINLSVKRIINAVILFFVPTIVSIIMNLLSSVGGEEYTACYTNANSTKIKELEKLEVNTSELFVKNDYSMVYLTTENKDACPKGFTYDDDVRSGKSGCYITLQTKKTDQNTFYWYITDNKSYCIRNWQFLNNSNELEETKELNINTSFCLLSRKHIDGENAVINDDHNNSNSSGITSNEIKAEYLTSPKHPVNVNDLSCSVTYAGNVLNNLTMNDIIKDSLHDALEKTCQYLRVINIYGTTDIATAGTQGSCEEGKILYPHCYAMGIDLFNNWTYTTKDGKTYAPYASYGDSSNYKKFICEVCNGKEDCQENLNYQIYEKIFKPLGYCWGGNWGEKFFDPMHYEYNRLGDGSCSTSNKITIKCD